MLMNKFIRRLLAALSVFLGCLALHGQNSAYTSYIEKYSDLAVEQMKRHRIPASITLAQGLLESAAGQSTLALKANNHFGIKTGGSWTGPYILRDDDAPNEKFRAYSSVEESYEDHSRFLTTRQRYSSLFDLSPTDYKGWAHGLKRAGYATNPRYAYNLIDIIERYDLHRFDSYRKGRKRRHLSERKRLKEEQEQQEEAIMRQAAKGLKRCNGAYYLIASSGMTYAMVADWAGISEKKLRRYNEVPKEMELSAGDIVYLTKKRTKASRKLPTKRHIVKAGESTHSIAQTYGIQLKSLYKMNRLPASYAPKAGDSLRVR